MSERIVPILACRDLDDVVPFYEALGFVQTFRQERPNPYLCLKRGDLDIHFASVASFEPEKSLGSILIDRAREVIAEVRSLNLTGTEKAAVSGELSAVAELESGL